MTRTSCNVEDWIKSPLMEFGKENGDIGIHKQINFEGYRYQ